LIEFNYGAYGSIMTTRLGELQLYLVCRDASDIVGG